MPLVQVAGCAVAVVVDIVLLVDTAVAAVLLLPGLSRVLPTRPAS